MITASSSEELSEVPDEEQAVVVTPKVEETAGSKNSGCRKKILLGCFLLVCAGTLVGVLATKPWQSNDETQQGSSDTNKAVAAPWPHENSDLQPDPRVTYGSLDNGLRYMVMENSEPPNQLMVRMHVDAGSYQEEEDQLGLAHFLEHMAFNGLKNFDADELIPKMQRLGIAFGAHANAATYFDETYYELDVPDANDEKAMDLVFNVMRDYADGMLLEEEEIEKERGVILSELTVRDSVSYRLTQQLWKFLLPGHRLPLRWPGGDPDVISVVPHQRFVDFYEQYYTPERITVIVCGDADPKEMQQKIKATYETMTATDRALDVEDDIELGTVVSAGTGFEAAVFSDEELVNEEMFLTFARPYTAPVDTESSRISQFPLSFAHSILSRRLQIVAKEEGSPIRTGSASTSGRGGILGRSGIETGSISVTLASSDKTNWKASIPIIEQEFRRALLFGFAAYEFDEMKANYLSFYQQSVDAASTRNSRALAGHLLSTIKDDSVFTTPEEDLRIFSQAMESITLDDLHTAFTSFWETSDLKLVLYAKEAESDTSETMKQLYEESKLVEVEPPVMELDSTFLYTSFGEPGTVVSDTVQEDLDIRQLKLSNNVRVNLKKTDFKANAIGISAQFGTGRHSQDPTKPGLQWLAEQMMTSGGLGQHSADDLQRINAGKNVGVRFDVSEGHFQFSGSTTPNDLQLQMQLMTAYISDPGFRGEAFQYWKQSVPSYDTMFRSQVDGAKYFVNAFLRGDERFAVPTLDEMNTLTTEDVKDWLEPQLAESYLEISIVGAFDTEATVEHILNTFGALPKRADSPAAVDDELRSLNFPETPAERTFTYESKLPSASSIVVWEVPHTEKDITLTRHFNVLSSILRDRMRKEIREDIGESYSPGASTDISDEFLYGVIKAESPGTSDVSESIGRQIIAIAKNMTIDITEDELVRAKEPMLTNIESTLRSNSYWLGSVMLQSQAKPWTLDWARTLREDYASITLGEIQELAAIYLKPSNAIRMEIHPVNVEAE